jgi:hypothetical protein
MVAVVQHAIATIHIDQGEAATANEILASIDPEVSAMNELGCAKVLSARAQVAALEGSWADAILLFEAAADGLAKVGEPADIALLGLRKIRALLACGRHAEANGTMRELLSLATRLRSDQVGEAILLELARHSYRGQLTAAVVDQAIQSWKMALLQRIGEVATC